MLGSRHLIWGEYKGSRVGSLSDSGHHFKADYLVLQCRSNIVWGAFEWWMTYSEPL